MNTPEDVLHEFDRLWKPPAVSDAAIRLLPPPTPENDAELDGPVRSEAGGGAIIRPNRFRLLFRKA